MAALRTLQTIEAEQRPATPGEQQQLARWSGWGAVPQVFDPQDATFTEQRQALHELLGPNQLTRARTSALNAHYTDVALAWPMWQAITATGLTGGTVLEPGCGAGTFLGLAPEGFHPTGVELEPTTAGIAAALYPQAHIHSGSFAEVTGGEDFDAVIGNVPFGQIRLHDPAFNPDRHPIHTHFVLKSLALAKPGAPVALVVSRYVLDSQDPTARQAIAEQADLLQAVRLPSGAHQRAAGTEVVTDVLLLRKRAAGEPERHVGAWQQVEQLQLADEHGGSHDLAVNEFFAARPARVLGTLSAATGRFARAEVVVTDAPADVGGNLAAELTQAGRGAAADAHPPPTGGQISAPVRLEVDQPESSRFEGMLAANPEGTFSRWQSNRWQVYEVPQKRRPELRQLLMLRDTVRQLQQAEVSSTEDTVEMDRLRRQLGEQYDVYHRRYGPVNRFGYSTRALPGWTAFSRWCTEQGYERLPADLDAVTGYLQHLADAGVDQQRSRRHWDAIQREHTKRGQVEVLDAVTEQAERLVNACPVQPADELDLVELGLATRARNAPGQGGFRGDPFSSLVYALELFDPATQTAQKAPLFHDRAIRPRPERTRAESPQDAIAVSLNRHNALNLNTVAELLGLDSAAEAAGLLTDGEQPLAFTDPDTGQIVARNDYLSGDVRSKLRAAQTAAETDTAWHRHVDALQQVVPATLGPEEIEVQLGAWVPAEYVQQFMQELLQDERVRVHYPGAGLWSVEGGNTGSRAATIDWGTRERPAQQLAEAALNGRSIRVTYTDRDGNMHTDAEATEQAQAKAAEIKDRFGDWVWEAPTRAGELQQLYNDRFNARVPRVYDDVELTLPGLAEHIQLREHQYTAVAAQLHNPSFGLYHEVGAGKTLEMIVGAMERKRLGVSERQLFNVPNHMLEQVEREWLQAYPQARLLCMSREDLSSPQRRRDFAARAATGDFDAIVMTESAFQALPVSPEVAERFYAAERDEIQRALDTAQAEQAHKRTVKQLEERLARATEATKAKTAGLDRDAGLLWDDLAIDTVVVDESQRFKNARRHSSLPGLGHEGSQRAIDLDMKLADLEFRFGHARYVSATATPFTNSLGEIYTELSRFGADLDDVDSWARTWGRLSTTQEMVPGGGYKEMTRLREIINAPDLARQLRQHADIRTSEHLGLPTPRITGGQPQIITIDGSSELGEFNARLAGRYRNLKPNPEKGDDNHLSLINAGMQAALDMRLVDGTGQERQKVDELADRIHARWLEHREDVYRRDDGSEHPTRGSLQLVFCSASTPKQHEWNLYDEIREQLADRGLPRELVRFIHDAKNDQQKGELFAAARSGEVAVLIGSTERMGTGVNVQDRAIGMYQLTPPWRADVPHQEIGRVVRQGNHNPEVFVEQLVTAPSLETKKWNLVRDKDKGFRPLMTGDIRTRNLDMPDEDTDHFAELMAAASGDPRVLEKAELESQVHRLQRLEKAHARQQTSHRMTVAHAEEEIPQLQQHQAAIQQAIEQRRDTRGDAFAMTVAGQRYTSHSEAAAALTERLQQAVADAPREGSPQIRLGELGGQGVSAEIRRWAQKRTLALHLDGVPSEIQLHHHHLGRSNVIGRLQNWLDGLETQQATLADKAQQLADAAEQVRPAIGAPFARAGELAAAQQRLQELTNDLAGTDTTSGADTPQQTGETAPAATSTTSTSTTNTTGPGEPSAPTSAGSGQQNEVDEANAGRQARQSWLARLAGDLDALSHGAAKPTADTSASQPRSAEDMVTAVHTGNDGPRTVAAEHDLTGTYAPTNGSENENAAPAEPAPQAATPTVAPATNTAETAPSADAHASTPDGEVGSLIVDGGTLQPMTVPAARADTVVEMWQARTEHGDAIRVLKTTGGQWPWTWEINGMPASGRADSLLQAHEHAATAAGEAVNSRTRAHPMMQQARHAAEPLQELSTDPEIGTLALLERVRRHADTPPDLRTFADSVHGWFHLQSRSPEEAGRHLARSSEKAFRNWDCLDALAAVLHEAGYDQLTDRGRNQADAMAGETVPQALRLMAAQARTATTENHDVPAPADQTEQLRDESTPEEVASASMDPSGDMVMTDTAGAAPVASAEEPEASTMDRFAALTGELPDAYAAAMAWHEAGCAVVPVRSDGSKAPTVPWRAYVQQQTRPAREQLDAWFAAGEHTGVAVLTGAVSGGLEMVEFEGRAMSEGLVDQWQQQMHQAGHGELADRVWQGLRVASPSGGVHMYLRVADGEALGNVKLASRPAHAAELTDTERQRVDGGGGTQPPRVLAETRGEGGLVVAAGSHGSVHSSGQPWRLVAGAPETVPLLSAAERDVLLDSLAALDQMPTPEPMQPAQTNPAATRHREAREGLLPGEDFHERGDWQMLVEHGWTVVRTTQTQTYWRRPGKDDQPGAVSAVTGGSQDYLWVWSTSTVLPAEQALSKWRTYALLEHDGDFQAAARALHRAGYGELPHRELTLQHRRDSGVLLLGTDRGDGLKDLFTQAQESGRDPGMWSYSRRIHVEGQSGAWYLPRTRNGPLSETTVQHMITTVSVLRDRGFQVSVDSDPDAVVDTPAAWQAWQQLVGAQETGEDTPYVVEGETARSAAAESDSSTTEEADTGGGRVDRAGEAAVDTSQTGQARSAEGAEAHAPSPAESAAGGAEKASTAAYNEGFTAEEPEERTAASEVGEEAATGDRVITHTREHGSRLLGTAPGESVAEALRHAYLSSGQPVGAWQHNAEWALGEGEPAGWHIPGTQGRAAPPQAVQALHNAAAALTAAGLSTRVELDPEEVTEPARVLLATDQQQAARPDPGPVARPPTAAEQAIWAAPEQLSQRQTVSGPHAVVDIASQAGRWALRARATTTYGHDLALHTSLADEGRALDTAQHLAHTRGAVADVGRRGTTHGQMQAYMDAEPLPPHVSSAEMTRRLQQPRHVRHSSEPSATPSTSRVGASVQAATTPPADTGPTRTPSRRTATPAPAVLTAQQPPRPQQRSR